MMKRAEEALKNLSASFFDDCGELRQVCFSLPQVILHFEHMKIEVRNTCEIQDDEGTRWVWRAFEVSDMIGLGNLLGYTIRQFNVLSPAKLQLTFSNGYTLLLTADETGYECFIISKEGGYGKVIV